MIEGDAVRFDGESVRQPPLQRDRDVAEPQSSVPPVQEGLRHEPGGVGEVDEPGARSAAPRRLLRQVEDHGDGAERLRESACPRGLLTDAAEPPGDRLVGQPRRLATDAELHDHEVDPLQGLIPAIRQDEPAVPTDAPEHASGQRPHDLEACRVGVQEDELVDGEPIRAAHQPLDEFGRVRASPTHDGHLHTHGTASYTARRGIVRKLS